MTCTQCLTAQQSLAESRQIIAGCGSKQKTWTVSDKLNAVERVAHYRQKQTKFASFFNVIGVTCTFISVLNELTAYGVTV